MKPFSRSVIELFDGKKRYAIPMFQRQYAWREERQLGRIWVDLKARTEQRLDNKTTSPHFLGAIVISLLPTFGRQVQAYDVIDGQAAFDYLPSVAECLPRCRSRTRIGIR
jgi:uncharacterized protein with ParB-like and HNH nuclease domain